MAATPRSSIHGASAMCLLLFLLAPTTFVVASSVSGAEAFNGSCIMAERDALLSLKAGITSDATRRLRSWRGQDCCLWYGVGCSATTGHVVKLDLRNDFYYEDFDGDDDQVVHWLRGQISSSLLSLRHLKHLDLSENALGGNMSIPKFMGSLRRLTYLDLSNMDFIGQVPPQLGNLTKLVFLDIHKDLSYAYEFGHAYSSDVSWLASLQSLRYLDMSGVNLGAAVHWVHAVNNLPNLRVLYLGNCNLSSSTPSLLRHNLTVLEELDLSRNPFNSPAAPNWYWDVTSLKSLIIFKCELSGPFPDELGNLTMLENLDMGWNNIKGMIPSTLKNNTTGDITDLSSSLLALRHLKQLDLSGNALGGNMSIPKFMGSLRSLTYLDLSNMDFIGQVPPQLGNLTKLVFLDIHKDLSYADEFGHAYSSDVSWLASLQSLRYLDMSGVNLGAAVHWVHAVNNLPNLMFLYLSYCNLSSSTPSLLRHNLTVLEELYLSGNPFNSPAAPNWYWDVTSLKSLDIEECELSGPFPDELGNLTMLENLDMGWNNIKGMVPSTLKNMRSLQSIYLAENNIAGDITDLIERLPNCSWNSLQELVLFGANISGTTLKSVLNLTALSTLFIHRNHLSGSVPVEIGTLKYLTELHIGDNSLNGVISEAHFSCLTNLKSIHLSHTYLQVVMDSNWEPPFNLGRAFLSSLHLGPQVPNWLRWQKSISYLEMSSAGLIGRIPDWFWTTFSNTRHLDLSYNQMSGELPLNLESSMSVQELFLQSNHLGGSIPQLPRSIVLLDISENSLNGQLPSDFGAPYLQVAVLFSNCITGIVPYSICQWPHLQLLDLSNNMLTGGLPDCGKEELKQRNAYRNNSSKVNSANSYSLEVRTLRLNNNSLSGGFPLFLNQCQNLVFLDLSQNRFSGELPTWISEDMPRLVILRLRSNNFSGHIPVEITWLFSLRLLDLANNTFSGVIPRSLENLKSLTTTAVALDIIDLFREVRHYGHSYSEFDQNQNDSLALVIKGQVLEYQENAIYFMSIDLSCNRLAGQIPEEIASLLVLVNLNLSSNFLSGNIPYKIGNLQSLESLDLSNNNLSGEIPWRLSNLTSLSYMNLSYNNLSGRIPSGHQLDTLRTEDPASMYIGNPGLCGHPLPKLCPEDQPSKEDPKRFLEDDKTRMDFHLGLVLGFFVGLWMIFCTLFKKAWRHAYFSLLDKLYDKVHSLSVVTWQKCFRKTGTTEQAL